MTSYKPGETFPNLKNFLKEEIEEVSRFQVPLGEPSIVCFDSEAFRYLVLLHHDTKDTKSNIMGDKFQELGDTLQFARSWTISSEASEKIVSYSSELNPLSLKKMIVHNNVSDKQVDLINQIFDHFQKIARSLAGILSVKSGPPDRFKQLKQHLKDLLQASGFLSDQLITDSKLMYKNCFTDMSL